jgi:hypothetical protein
VLQIRKAMFRRLLQEYPEIGATLRWRLARNVGQLAAEFSDVGRKLAAFEG